MKIFYKILFSGLSACGLLVLASLALAGYDTSHVGEIYAINMPGLQNGQKITAAQGQSLVKQYRWIYANASLKSISEAKG